MKFWSAALLFLCGCVTGQSAFDAQWAREKAELLAKTVEPQCPSTHGAKECGLISQDLLKHATDFYSSYCAPHQIGAAGCVEALNKMIFARLEERYPQADWTAAKRLCDGHPIECDISKDGFGYLELELMRSHDDAIFAELHQRHSKIQARADADAARSRQAWGRALQAAGKSMQDSMQQPQAVHCTSNSYSGTTYTDCR